MQDADSNRQQHAACTSSCRSLQHGINRRCMGCMLSHTASIPQHHTRHKVHNTTPQHALLLHPSPTLCRLPVSTAPLAVQEGTHYYCDVVAHSSHRELQTIQEIGADSAHAAIRIINHWPHWLMQDSMQASPCPDICCLSLHLELCSAHGSTRAACTHHTGACA